MFKYTVSVSYPHGRVDECRKQRINIDFQIAEFPARPTRLECDLSDGYPKGDSSPTCHAGGKEIATGHGFDGDSRLTL